MTPALLGALVLVVVILGWFGYQWISARQALAAERAKILEGVAVELAREPLDTSELSQLMARIKKLEDHAMAHDLLEAQARIELARGRPERAADLFLPVASMPGATPTAQGLAARILLLRHQGGVADRTTAVGMLEEAIGYAQNSHRESGDVGDLLVAWLAAMRLSDSDRSKQFGERIASDHAGTDAADLVAVSKSFTLTTSRADLDVVRGGFDDPPPEIDAMITMVELQAGDLAEARSVVEPLLLRASGIVEVRLAAAAVFHVCALGSDAAGHDRAQWTLRRDTQLDWLLGHAAADDARRQKWRQMKSQR